MENKIKVEIDNLLEETTQFDFPFLATIENKKLILKEKRLYVEEKLKSLVIEQFPTDEKIESIWGESVKYADAQFKSLPNNKRLNGFYLQELMHYYVEKLVEVILLNK